MNRLLNPLYIAINEYRKYYYYKPKAILLSPVLYLCWEKFGAYLPHDKKDPITIMEIPCYPFGTLNNNEFMVIGEEFGWTTKPNKIYLVPFAEEIYFTYFNDYIGHHKIQYPKNMKGITLEDICKK